MSGVRSIVSGAGALLVIQVANMVLPLVLVPYLASVLGVELYGITAFALAMVLMAGVVTDFGFTLSATSEVARLRDGPARNLAEFAGAVLVCKILLLLPVVFALAVFVYLDTKYVEAHPLFVALVFPIAAQAVQPLWFFQGIERMALVTWCTVGSKILYVLLTLLWVHHPTDLMWIGIAQGAGAVFSAAMAFYLLWKMGFRPMLPSKSRVQEAASSAAPFFFSRAAVMTYTSGTTFFLGVIGTPLQVGVYAAAEQFYKAGQSILGTLAQSLYPRMVRSRDMALFKKIFVGGVGVTLLGCLGGVAVGPILLPAVLGHAFAGAYIPFCAFMAALACVGPSMLIGYPLLAAFGNVKAANRSVLMGAAVQLAVLSILYGCKLVSATSVAASVFVTEAVVLGCRILSWRFLVTRPPSVT